MRPSHIWVDWSFKLFSDIDPFSHFIFFCRSQQKSWGCANLSQVWSACPGFTLLILLPPSILVSILPLGNCLMSPRRLTECVHYDLFLNFCYLDLGSCAIVSNLKMAKESYLILEVALLLEREERNMDACTETLLSVRIFPHFSLLWSLQ